MPVFNLPDGYSFDPPPSVQGIGVPDRGYGGADISQAFDATGQHYVACNAWGPGDPSFRWRAFKRVGAVYVEVPLPFLATGRGEQDVQWYDGRAWGIAWTGDQFNFDIIPSFVPFPSIPSLVARILGRHTCSSAPGRGGRADCVRAGSGAHALVVHRQLPRRVANIQQRRRDGGDPRGWAVRRWGESGVARHPRR